MPASTRRARLPPTSLTPTQPRPPLASHARSGGQLRGHDQPAGGRTTREPPSHQRPVEPRPCHPAPRPRGPIPRGAPPVGDLLAPERSWGQALAVHNDRVGHVDRAEPCRGRAVAPVAVLACGEWERLVEGQLREVVASDESVRCSTIVCDATTAGGAPTGATVEPAAAPCSAAAAASREAHPAAGSQSSSLKQTTSPLLARAPTLRAAAGPAPGVRTT
jgi:hypothetical protein